MKRRVTRVLSFALLGCTIAFCGCEKVAPAELSPKAAAASLMVVPTAGASLTPKQAAWLRFVDRVEKGELVDPLGQYLAKKTQTAANADGTRNLRPKFDAANLPGPGRNARLFVSGAEAAPADGPTDSSTAETGPNICEGCDTGTGIFYPPVTTTFTTSENQGGSGSIHDLKIVGGGNSTSRARALNNGYILLEADLNKGAAGSYIYFCFIRDAANVLSGLEYYQGQSNSTPFDVLTDFTTKNGSTFSKPLADNRYFDIWSPNQNPYYDWGYVDLNAGAGGEYIYSYQSKSNQISAFNGYFSEVGILSGNSSTIQPPSGWQKYPHDLNEGAGGDFIYFCYKY